MPNAMVALANGTLGADAASVSFTSISGAYKDLFLVCETSNSSLNTALQISMNSNSPAINRVIITGRAGARTSASGASLLVSGNYTNDTPSATTCSILDYAATDKGKVAIIRNGGAVSNSSDNTSITVLQQNTTTAVTSITISYASGNLRSGSRFALYGIS